jgi:hypothetical protein
MIYKVTHSGISFWHYKEFKSERAAKQWLRRLIQPSIGGKMEIAVQYAVDGGYRFDVIAVKNGHSKWKSV